MNKEFQVKNIVRPVIINKMMVVLGMAAVAGCAVLMNTSSNATSPTGENFSASAAQRPPYGLLNTQSLCWPSDMSPHVL